jgi:hypothetical protein
MHDSSLAALCSLLRDIAIFFVFFSRLRFAFFESSLTEISVSVFMTVKPTTVLHGGFDVTVVGAVVIWTTWFVGGVTLEIKKSAMVRDISYRLKKRENFICSGS